MKNIKDFEKFFQENTKYKYPYDDGHTFENFMKVNDVDDDTITEDMMDWYCNHIGVSFTHPSRYNSDIIYHWKHVNEMLKKTSIELLVKSLNRSLSLGKDGFVTNKSGKDDDHINTLWITPNIYNEDKIFEICDKMMWVFTSVEIDEYENFGNPFEYEPYVNTNVCSFPVIRIRVEPVKTKIITDFIKSNCGGKIYHICDDESLKWIMKSGLRVRGRENKYRYINNRLFFVCGETKDDIIKNLEIVAKTKNAWDEGIKDNYSIVEIDVNGYNIDFYQDGMYEDDVKYIGYTYNYFPPKRLRIIDINEL